MKAADFILIQVEETDKYYELARVRPYEDTPDYFYCQGFAQNNGSFYEFNLDLGQKLEDVKFNHILLGYPVSKHDGEKVKVKS
jgi:hypothetical protein